MVPVQGTRPRTGRGRSTSTVEAGYHEQSPDDWLGDVSDDDWDEHPQASIDQWPAAPAFDTRRADDSAGDEVMSSRGDAGSAVDARRATVERRRIVAGGVLVGIVGIVAAVLVVLLRGGDATPVPPATGAAGAITAPSETEVPGTSTGSVTTTPSSSSPAQTTEPADTTSGFNLPEGTKLRSGEEADPAVVASLQRALTSAGYDPGPADGTYGARTVAAVVAFQQDNDLDPDGVVGSDTAAALNAALPRG